MKKILIVLCIGQILNAAEEGSVRYKIRDSQPRRISGAAPIVIPARDRVEDVPSVLPTVIPLRPPLVRQLSHLGSPSRSASSSPVSINSSQPGSPARGESPEPQSLEESIAELVLASPRRLTPPAGPVTLLSGEPNSPPIPPVPVALQQQLSLHEVISRIVDDLDSPSGDERAQSPLPVRDGEHFFGPNEQLRGGARDDNFRQMATIALESAVAPARRPSRESCWNNVLTVCASRPKKEGKKE